MNRIILYLIIVSAFTSFSCTKNSSDTSVPTITFTLPVQNQVYTSGQIVNIKGTLSDNELHEAKLTITNNAGGTELYSKYLSVHGAPDYPMNENWTPVVAVVVNATIKMEVSDFSGNKAEKTVSITINP